MKHLETRLVAMALLCGSVGAPALAESLAASSASSASAGTSASSGSVSDSFKGSSGSSQGTGATAGDYRVIDVAAVAERPGMARITLQALAADAQGRSLTLDLPQLALERGGVGLGQVVAVQPRPYGLEFARSDTRQAFFLVLDDDWHRDLGAHAVAL
jgi:hypothetical protein